LGKRFLVDRPNSKKNNQRRVCDKPPKQRGTLNLTSVEDPSLCSQVQAGNCRAYGEHRHAVSVWPLAGSFSLWYRGVMGEKAADGVFQTSPCLVLRLDWKSQRTRKSWLGVLKSHVHSYLALPHRFNRSCLETPNYISPRFCSRFSFFRERTLSKLSSSPAHAAPPRIA
jgi:hypothetical protein